MNWKIIKWIAAVLLILGGFYVLSLGCQDLLYEDMRAQCTLESGILTAVGVVIVIIASYFIRGINKEYDDEW